jgi:predicted Zn-dependent protease
VLLRVLAAAVRHELGHVLGLLHDPASRLMSPVHDPAGQRCIDKATIAAVARMRGLPIDELNWCEDGQNAG